MIPMGDRSADVIGATAKASAEFKAVTDRLFAGDGRATFTLGEFVTLCGPHDRAVWWGHVSNITKMPVDDLKAKQDTSKVHVVAKLIGKDGFLIREYKIEMED